MEVLDPDRIAIPGLAASLTTWQEFELDYSQVTLAPLLLLSSVPPPGPHHQPAVGAGQPGVHRRVRGDQHGPAHPGRGRGAGGGLSFFG